MTATAGAEYGAPPAAPGTLRVARLLVRFRLRQLWNAIRARGRGRVRHRGRVADEAPPAHGVFERAVEDDVDDPARRRREPPVLELGVEAVQPTA